MSEITKLYENARIKPTYTDECQIADSYYSMAKDLNERGILFDDYMKQECPNKNEVCYETCPYAYNKEFYPPFTAEKQLLLLQWIVNKTDLYLHRHKTDFTYSIASEDIAVNKNKDFKESIAEFINTTWQDLTEEEKQQVKGILE